MATDSRVEVEFSATTDQFSGRVEELNSAFKEFDSAASSTKVAVSEVAGGMGELKLATSGVSTELIRLGHEALTGNFSRIPGSLLVLTSRLGGLSLGFIGIVASVAAAGAAVFELVERAEKAAQFLDDVNTAMQSTSKNLSTEEMEKYVEILAKIPDVSTKTARAIEVSFARAHDVGTQYIGPLTGMIEKMSIVTGESADKVAASFIKMFQDPAKGVDELQKTFNYTLDPALVQTVKQTQELNGVIAAQPALLNLLASSVEGVTVKYETFFGTLLDFIAKSDSWDAYIDKQREMTAGQKEDAAAVAATGAEIQRNNQLQQAALDVANKINSQLSEQQKLQGEINVMKAAKNQTPYLLNQERTVYQQIADLRSADTEKLASNLSQQRSLYAENFADYREKEELKVEVGAETSAQMYQNLFEATTAEAVLAEQSLQKQLSLYSTQSKEWEILHQQMLNVAQKFQNDLDKLQLQQQKSADEENKKWVNSWMQSLNKVNSTFASTITGMLSGSKNFTQVFQDLARTAFEGFIKYTLEAGEKFLLNQLKMTGGNAAGNAARTASDTAAATAGEAAQSASSSSSIMKDAGTAAAGAYAALASIPYVGPVIAPIAAAVAFAAVMAFDSFDKGTDYVPHDMLANIHKGEIIVPAAQAEGLRSGGNAPSFTGGGLGGDGGSHVHFHISAMDGKDAGRFFKKNGKAIAGSLKNHLRGGNARNTLARS